MWRRLKEHPLARVGPGLITGVADDDPSGIATYSQAGAQFGLNMLWTMPLAFPLMSAMQSMCAQIGRVTGKGLAANIKTAFPPVVLHGVVLLLLIANTLNIAADIAAMGEVAELVTGVNRHLMTAVFVLGTLLLQIFIPYHRYVVFLKWLTLSLLAYAAVCSRCMSRGARSRCARSGRASRRTPMLPRGRRRLRHDHQPLPVLLAGLRGGRGHAERARRRAPAERSASVRSESCAASGGTPGAACSTPTSRPTSSSWRRPSTLNVAGITNIETAAQAASALRPLAGDFAFMLFALGILGVGLIGVPVLAGSAAYALCEAMGWKRGLERKARDARGFLQRHSRQRLGRARHPVFADQSDEGAVLERGDQRRRGRAFDGGDHRAGSKKSVMGAFTAHRPHCRPWLDRHGGHGRGGRPDVPALMVGGLASGVSFVIARLVG